MKVLGIAQRDEEIAAAIDVAEGAEAKVAGAVRRELAGPHLAGVRDVDEAARAVERRVEDLAARGVLIDISSEVAPLGAVRGQSGQENLLEAEAAIVRRLDHAQREALTRA